MRAVRLKYISRERPDEPATVEFTRAEIDAALLLKKPKGFRRGMTPTVGQIDIKNNALIVQVTAGTKLTIKQTLAGQITSATFKNIISSSAATNPAYRVVMVDNNDLGAGSTNFGGQPVDANSLIITQALEGDGNLDGFVDLTDFNTSTFGFTR